VTIRAVVDEIVRLRKPIVFHNGFVDLIFLYQNFYANLPSDLQEFVRDLSDMFPSIYDTKFISEDGTFRSSFLEFVFYERQRRNLYRMMKGQRHSTIVFNDNFDSTDVEFRDLKTKILVERPEGIDICKHYGFHGWCEQGIECDKSHNIDFILDISKMTTKGNGKRTTRHSKLEKLRKFSEKLVISSEQSLNGPFSEVVTLNESLSSEVGRCKSAAHRAGYDAFMTGYSFVGYLISTNVILRDGYLNKRDVETAKFVNNVFLSGKEQPLRIRPSNFSKTSKNHKDKIEKLRPTVLK
jgi:target of EGR1 protein 1